jgi:hypothetical protein
MNKLEYYKKIFLKKLVASGDCLLFMGSRNKKGYGQSANPIEIFAHRFAWHIHHGPIPEGMIVMHLCDTPPCCEITHLKLGTSMDNTKDMIAKGRQQDYSNMPKGEKSPTSKIKEEDAQKVAQLISEGLTTPQISHQLNISNHIINDIRCRKTWTHLKFIVPPRKEFKKNCLICGTEFKMALWAFEKTKYCSHKCYSKSLEKEKDSVICQGCGKEGLFLIRKDQPRKYCKIECLWDSMKGKYPENIKKRDQQ